LRAIWWHFSGLVAHLQQYCLAADHIPAIAVHAAAGSAGWIDTNLARRAREQIDGLHDKVLGRAPAARWGAIARGHRGVSRMERV